ncbi:MAG: DUF805 domain-containing protein [Candidatus Acidiferrales bacterium]
MDWYLVVLKKYAVFTGRARRKEYWYFCLFNALIFIAIVFVERLMRTPSQRQDFGLLLFLYWLAITIPGLTVTVRRLHDTGRSGKWFFIALLPLIGGVVLLVFHLEDSQAGENRYGPDPKAAVRSMLS